MTLLHGLIRKNLQKNHQQPNKYEWSLNSTTQEDFSYVCVLFHYAVSCSHSYKNYLIRTVCLLT